MKDIPSPKELLVTNGLNLEQIHERLELIKNLLIAEEIEFTEPQLKKLEKIIIKSNYNVDSQEENEKDSQNFLKEVNEFFTSMSPVSEKYFDIEKLQRLSAKLSFLVEEKDYELKATKSLRLLRSSSNFKDLENNIKSLTEIQKLEDGHFRIKYPIAKSKDHETHFEFEIKAKDNKIEIIFIETYKESNPIKMKPVDLLFPEEIQIAMLKKLLESYPEIEEKIRSAEKINCIRSYILNEKSLFMIGKYLQEKISNPKNSESKHILESTPNQSNSYNFINQLNHLLSLEIKPSTPPKVISTEKIDSYCLKQTFKHQENNLKE